MAGEEPVTSDPLDDETRLTEWEALVGTDLSTALWSATARVEAGQPYSLTAHVVELQEELTKVRGAFHKMAEDRNMWRARAKRAAAVARGRE
jgi:hypothetical protein